MDGPEQTISLTLSALPTIVFVAVLFWFATWSEKPKRACKCGRSRFFYFRPRHRKCFWMVIWGVYMALVTVSTFYTAGQHIRNDGGMTFWDWINSIGNTCIEIYLWRWVYFHEKDRLRRWSKAAGRVFVNNHGRLAVSNDT